MLCNLKCFRSSLLAASFFFPAFCEHIALFLCKCISASSCWKISIKLALGKKCIVSLQFCAYKIQTKRRCAKKKKKEKKKHFSLMPLVIRNSTGYLLKLNKMISSSLFVICYLLFERGSFVSFPLCFSVCAGQIFSLILHFLYSASISVCNIAKRRPSAFSVKTVE